MFQTLPIADLHHKNGLMATHASMLRCAAKLPGWQMASIPQLAAPKVPMSQCGGRHTDSFRIHLPCQRDTCKALGNAQPLTNKTHRQDGILACELDSWLACTNNYRLMAPNAGTETLADTI